MLHSKVLRKWLGLVVYFENGRNIAEEGRHSAPQLDGLDRLLHYTGNTAGGYALDEGH